MCNEISYFALKILNINDRSWSWAKEVCKALKCSKSTNATDVVKILCSSKDYAQNCQSKEFVLETNLMDWSKESRRDKHYINEEGMYILLFSNNEPKTKNFKRHCYNALFPHVWQQLKSKIADDKRLIHKQAIIEIKERISFSS